MAGKGGFKFEITEAKLQKFLVGVRWWARHLEIEKRHRTDQYNFYYLFPPSGGSVIN